MNTQRNIVQKPQRRLLVVVLAVALAAASCSAETSIPLAVEVPDDSSTAVVVDGDETTTEPTSAESETVEAPVDTGDSVETVETVEESQQPSVAWDGPAVAPLLDARMQELAAPFGAAFSVEAVAGIFEAPADFPYPEGTITGFMHTWDLDARTTDGVDIDEERIIGLDGDPSDTVLDAIADGLEADPASRWGRSSRQRQEGQAWNDLFTAEDGNGDGAKDRLVLTSDINPDPDESKVKIVIEVRPDAIPEPAWTAGFPVPEGGTLVEVVEANGLVKDFGRPGGNGTVTARWSYPVEAVPEIVAFMTSGIIGATGLTDDELSVSIEDPTGRVPIATEGWEGRLSVSTFSVGDADPAGYHVTWSLARS